MWLLLVAFCVAVLFVGWLAWLAVYVLVPIIFVAVVGDIIISLWRKRARRSEP